MITPQIGAARKSKLWGLLTTPGAVLALLCALYLILFVVRVSLSTVAPPGGIAIVGDGSAGQFTITMTAAATALLNFSSLKYDLEAVSGAGTVTRLLEGIITLSKEVTK